MSSDRARRTAESDLVVERPTKSFEVTILSQFCKGCGLCIEFCDQGKLYVEKKPNKRGIQVAAVHAEVSCTGCLKCATICPDAAVVITRVQVPVGSKAGGADQQAAK